MGIGVHFIYFIKVESNEFIYNSYNTRVNTFTDKVVRGDILSSDGKVLATTTVEEDGTEARVYPYNELFSHVVGYVINGSSGLESKYSMDLLKSNINGDVKISNDLEGKKNPGDNLYTTFDYETQKAAHDAINYYRGAVVAMEPDTGKIVAMVSKPDFDPNNLSEYWEFISDKENNSSILLNRATQGLYPPGSTFKIVTTLAYMRQNDEYNDFDFTCNGSMKLNDFTMHCAGGSMHGKEDLTEAFYKSCNCAYATIGNSLNINDYIGTTNDLLFNTELPTLIDDTKKSRFVLQSDDAKELIGQTAIGQGDTQVTPLHMCMLASAIANEGDLMKPYIVDKIVSDDGYLVSSFQSQSYGRLMSCKEAEELKGMMAEVMNHGSVADLNFGDVKVYGKTGTAQFTDSEDLTHSWFVGFAENEDGKKLAIAVIMEEAGSGSKYATPVAAQVISAYFE